MIKTADFVGRDPGEYDKQRKMIDVYLTNTKIIKKRSKVKDLCNDSLHDEDGKWLHEATKQLGCVPITWSSNPGFSSKNLNQTVCHGINDYKKLKELSYEPWTITKKYTPPCKYMTSSTYSKSSGNSELIAMRNLSKILDDQKIIMLRVIYKNDYYEEISNEQLFNEYDLFCQLGGIVGIMLGFSFVQLPELFSRISLASKYIFQNTKCKYCAR